MGVISFCLFVGFIGNCELRAQSIKTVDYLITPPAGLPEEDWMLIGSWKEIEPGTEEPADTIATTSYLPDVKRPIKVVVAGDEIYVRNIIISSHFALPDAWVKGNIYNDRIVFPPRQVTCKVKWNEEQYDIYFGATVIFKDSDGHNTGYESFLYALPTYMPLHLHSVERDGKKYYLTQENKCYGCGYAVTENSNGYRMFTSSVDYDDSYYSRPFPQYYTGVFPYIQLYRVSSGVSDITDAAEENAAVYDLMGRRMTHDNLAPGIYISGGKKFIVR